MKLAIKDIKRGQRLYDEDPNDFYKAYKDAEFVNGKWQVEVTTGGDHIWFFYEGDNLWDSPERID